MATKKQTFIECKISNELALRLENCKEVYGHDDSLPFNADVFVYDREDETGCFQRIATAYNDGWGGLTNIDTLHEKYQAKLCKINNYLRSHFEIQCKGTDVKWDVDLEYLISAMAYACIDMDIHRMSVTDLEDCVTKK